MGDAPSDSASDQAYIKGQLQGLRAALRQQGPPPAGARRASTPERRADSPGRVPGSQRASSPGRRRDEEGQSGGGGARGSPQPPRLERVPSAPDGGKAVGSKSDCVLRVEQMQRQREERRRKAEEVKVRRAEETKEAEGRGGIESVEFLRKIRDYREANALLKPPEQWGGADVWSADAGSRIRVCVRKRPMLRVEELRHDFDVVSCEDDHAAVVCHEPKTKVDLAKGVDNHRFTFDAVFTEADSNATVYTTLLRPLLEHVLQGGMATVFAFGQTGSGKTCTMAGHGRHELADGNALGLYALAAEEVVAAATVAGLHVRMSFYEVYRGQVLDLLRERARLEVLEDGRGRVQVVGLREVEVASAAELMAMVKQAEELRATGATSANETSSRSHAILQVLQP